MLPTSREIWTPLLCALLSRGGKSSTTERDQQGRNVYESLSEYFELSKDDLKLKTDESPRRSLWENRIRTAVKDLKEYGYLSKTESRGVWNVTASGEAKVNRSKYLIPEELDEGDRDSGQSFVEGAHSKITVNSYERNLDARTACIKHHKCHCAVCGFDFKKKYGSTGAGYIHVHHLKLISTVTEAYVVDPVNDLIPVCANCHAIIHRKRIPYTIDEVKEMIAKQELR